MSTDIAICSTLCCYYFISRDCLHQGDCTARGMVPLTFKFRLRYAQVMDAFQSWPVTPTLAGRNEKYLLGRRDYPSTLMVKKIPDSQKVRSLGFGAVWICMQTRMWWCTERPSCQQTKLLLTLALNNSAVSSFLKKKKIIICVFSLKHCLFTFNFLHSLFSCHISEVRQDDARFCALWSLPFWAVQIQFGWNHSVKNLTVQSLWTELKHFNKINACTQCFLCSARQSAYIQ